MKFSEFAERLSSQKGRAPVDSGVPLLAFDPGHTSGWALFLGYELIEYGQIDTRTVEIATPEIINLLDWAEPHNAVLEDYRVYAWRAQHHAGSELVTSQVIGAMSALCSMRHIPVFKQPAQIAKGFCTDRKLKAWNMYPTSEKHARDAIRHGCYFLLFGAVKGKGKRGSRSQPVG